MSENSEKLDQLLAECGATPYFHGPGCGAAREQLKKAEVLLKDIKEHCLCTRNDYGFDYGEVHDSLGKPGSGKRWLTPDDMIDAYFAARESRPAMHEGESK